jgi:hypothetical protein
MTIHPLAGKPATREFLVDVDELRKEYYARKPDISENAQRVSSGLKVVTAEGWFAARPSGTEEVYKLYAKVSRRRASQAPTRRSAGDRQRSVGRSDWVKFANDLLPFEQSAPQGRGFRRREGSLWRPNWFVSSGMARRSGV